MKCFQPLILACTLFLLTLPSIAQNNYKQERVNITIQVTSFSQAAADLREVISQFDASVQNLNLNRGNTSGNANLRVPPAQMAKLVEEISNIGEVENQSQSTNDFTSSYKQYDERLRTYQAMRKMNLAKNFNQLPEETRTFAHSEYNNWLKNQINSAESSLKSYKDQAKHSEVYVNFTLLTPEAAAAAQQAKQQSDDDPAANKPAPTPVPKKSGPSPEFFILCFVNMLGLWLIYRKVDGRTQPGLHD